MKTFLKIMVILMGIVLGIYLGELLSNIPALSFLSYGKELGLTNPISLNLGFLSLTFGLMIKLNIAGIIGFILAICIIKWVIK